MAALSWSKDAPRRISPGIGLLISVGVSLLLWALIAALAQVL
ncbi:MAG TPA: hypothetical protein VJS38_08110 [Phenylobacterium sp.]|nr:hypothetical protein [Phenylobacterium sp.]HKR88127.1 hypothetical protein [Phenylobacterium sp.]HKT53536.1 hypothetical protein [Caulobacteraceae bacterium]